MFQIRFTMEASDDLHGLRKFEQVIITRAIRSQLTHEPNKPTRNRKRLRPNPLAEWELRVDEFRVFYDVDLTTRRVSIAAIGLKQGSRLFVHGQEYQL